MTTLKNPVSTKDHVQGSEKAPITLVEYGDYQCPYCAKAYFAVKQLQKHFGKQLKFVFRNFPLKEAHPYAQAAAEVAEFAADQGLFWEMHDKIYENQSELSPKLLLQLAEDLDLPLNEFKQVLEKHTYAEKIQADFMGGVRSGVNGTPTFFINGERYNGSFDYPSLISALEAVVV